MQNATIEVAPDNSDRDADRFTGTRCRRDYLHNNTKPHFITFYDSIRHRKVDHQCSQVPFMYLHSSTPRNIRADMISRDR
ncbi:hypothetical protein ACN38_g1545 [Penicillium nordicum]|uniref:Uncharacterized protein n=1 Tax=Penicillium nordicum TaxID=229535 RepID=A0A0M9WJT5_9EURO|nr:hypothetical protein ACN38_g1545 [Penicillium nordicum]